MTPKLTLCPQCNYVEMLRLTSVSKLIRAPGVISHNSNLVCPVCGLRIDLTWDIYRFNLAIICRLRDKPTSLSRDDVLSALYVLTIHAGCNSDFAQLIGFGNYDLLEQYKIDFRKMLYLSQIQDEDERACIAPFWREARSLVAQQLGFRNDSDLEEYLLAIDLVDERLDNSVKRFLADITAPDYPTSNWKIDGDKCYMHLYY